MGLLAQLKEKRIRYMLLISAGFSETGEEGSELEKNLVKAAQTQASPLYRSQHHGDHQPLCQVLHIIYTH